MNGRIYAEGKSIQFAEFMAGGLSSAIRLEKGVGSFEQWAVFEKSALVSTIGKVNVSDITLNKPQKKLSVDKLSGQINAINNGAGWHLGLLDFAMTANHKNWLATTLSLSINKGLTEFAMSAAALDLKSLMQMVQFFIPPDTENEKIIQKIVLAGNINDFSAFVDTKNDKYAVNGVFDAVSFSAPDNNLHVKNLTGSINGHDTKGTITFNTQKGQVYFPRLFRQAFNVNKISGNITWQKSLANWNIYTEQLLLDTEQTLWR